MRRGDGHSNRAGQGKPPAPFPGFYASAGLEHVGDVITPRMRYWIEGEVIVNDVDDEGKLLAAKLKPMLEQLSNRRDETGRPFPDSAFTLCGQPIPSEGRAPRRYRSGLKGGRRKLDELNRYVESYPGHTADQMIEYFYGPGLSATDLQRARSSMKMAIWRLKQKHGVEQKFDEHGVLHFYPPGDSNARVKVDARVRAIAAAIAFARDGRADTETARSHYLEAAAIAELIDHNRDRPADAWRSPPRDGEERPF